VRGTFHILRADGDEVHGIRDKPAELEWLQQSVGGLIEIIPGFTKYLNHPCVAFCNEEGKILELPVNKEATMAWRRCMPTSDILHGDVLIVSGDREFMETL
jgi:hypothetical protein